MRMYLCVRHKAGSSPLMACLFLADSQPPACLSLGPRLPGLLKGTGTCLDTNMVVHTPIPFTQNICCSQTASATVSPLPVNLFLFLCSPTPCFCYFWFTARNNYSPIDQGRGAAPSPKAEMLEQDGPRTILGNPAQLLSCRTRKTREQGGVTRTHTPPQTQTQRRRGEGRGRVGAGREEGLRR